MSADLPEYIKSLLPAEPSHAENEKLTLRFVECEISEISKAGLITIKAREPVIQVNQGNKIDKDLLDLLFVKGSPDYDVKLDSWKVAN